MITTDFAKKSGPGTAMFSTPGRETITASVLWQLQDQDIPKELGGSKVPRKFQTNGKNKEKGKFNPQAYMDGDYLKK